MFQHSPFWHMWGHHDLFSLFEILGKLSGLKKEVSSLILIVNGKVIPTNKSIAKLIITYFQNYCNLLVGLATRLGSTLFHGIYEKMDLTSLSNCRSFHQFPGQTVSFHDFRRIFQKTFTVSDHRLKPFSCLTPQVDLRATAIISFSAFARFRLT